MRIAFVTVEMSPLAKVGGLADVAGALPQELHRLGHEIRVIMPLHGIIDRTRYALARLPITFSTHDLGGRQLQTAVWRYNLAGVPVDLLDIPELYQRPQVYGEADDERRWLVFCSALLSYLAVSEWQPELLHLNDWHSAFAGTLLRQTPDSALAALPRLYTVHNLAIHGGFSEQFATEAGITAAALSSPLVWEPWVSHSGMGQGLLWSDEINTVSPTYAREILTPEYGAGLDPLLRARREHVHGILNGIDYVEFDPATDPRLEATFDFEHFEGHAANKAALQHRLGLVAAPNTPLLGMVTRLFYQKGADLAVLAVENALRQGRLQLVVLGTGDKQYHDELTALAARYPGAVAVRLAFDADLAQLIYGGSDMFLMPSRFEPCGLGQLIALRYGSVPIVRRTGGLADTVHESRAGDVDGNGFVFERDSPAELAAAIERALAAFANPERWRRLRAIGMYEDHSWRRAAVEYSNLYQRAGESARDMSSSARRRTPAA